MKHFRLSLMLIAMGTPTFVGCSDEGDTIDPPNAGAGSASDMDAIPATAGAAAPATDERDLRALDRNEPGQAPRMDDPDTSEPNLDEPNLDEPNLDEPNLDEPQQEPSTNETTELADIVDTAVEAGSFTALADALTQAGLVEALQGEGPFTVFAPTDEAFSAFEEANPGVLESLSAEELTEILTYHVIAGATVRSTDLADGQLAATLAGPVVAVDLTDGVKINGVSVSTADIEAKNGVIHVIDQIIMPPGDIVEVATAAGSFTQLANALDAANLVDTLKGDGPFTVFAPTDAAFEALAAVPEGDALSDVLLYHVLEGIAGPLDLRDGGAAVTAAGAPVLFNLADGAKINDAVISTTNVVANNGVIHVIDAVMLPPTRDIVETAIDAGVFSSLAGALTSADLVPTLQGPGPFTVFAPTDDAFAALPTVPEGDALSDVLLYHVVDGAIGSGNLADGAVEMVSGSSVTVDLEAGVRINGSTVTQANVLATNGIIHIIDGVLIPE
ncbi:MAG: fasciclin domain-containing protein [Myxococcales bacterium]|nr:fasciclin domain-containing protein [Myxococcales bacterium]